MSQAGDLTWRLGGCCSATGRTESRRAMTLSRERSLVFSFFVFPISGLFLPELASFASSFFFFFFFGGSGSSTATGSLPEAVVDVFMGVPKSVRF